MSTQYKLYKRIKKRFPIFRDEGGTPYSGIYIGGQQRPVRLHSSMFDGHLRNQYERQYRALPNRSQLEQCREQLCAHATRLTEATSVFQRVGQRGNAVYLDLGGDRPIWRISKHSIAAIQRSKCMMEYLPKQLPLPEPDLEHPSIDALWKILSLTDKRDQKLILAWLIKAMLRVTPCPILVFLGPPGSGKSTSQRFVKAVLDPSADNLRCPPTASDAIRIAAPAGFILAYHNISQLNRNQQDDCCMVCDGGVHGRRKLFTTGDEVYDPIMRPMILSGITPFVTAPDLLQRSLVFTLKERPAGTFSGTESIDRQFRDSHAQMLGWLLLTLKDVLTILPTLPTDDHTPRMADYFKVGLAMEQALHWKTGSFAKAFKRNQARYSKKVIKDLPLGAAILRLWNEGVLQHGTHTFKELNLLVRNLDPACSYSDKGLSQELKRITPGLKKAYGIEIKRLPRSSNGFPLKFLKKPRRQ